MSSSPQSIATENGGDRSPQDPSSPERGVKEDLSDLKNTLTRQFWGVASFLAPPPQPRPIGESSGDRDDASGVDGIRGDLAEIGGKFRSGISKLSDNIKVSDFAKIASNFLQLGEDGTPQGAVGVTDDVVAFARDVSMHPETWLDFPLPDDDDDDEEDDEFDLSDAQQEHALAVESLAPGLASLRIELCPRYMSESCFWKIYFVLLHPKLNKNDALVLSTPQIMKARAFLTPELRNRPKVRLEKGFPETNTTTVNEMPLSPKVHSEGMPLDGATMGVIAYTADPDFEVEKHPIQSTHIPVVDKSVVVEGSLNSSKDQDSYSGASSKVLVEKYDEGDDDWLKEESLETAGSAKPSIHNDNDEDVSFSDLEED